MSEPESGDYVTIWEQEIKEGIVNNCTTKYRAVAVRNKHVTGNLPIHIVVELCIDKDVFGNDSWKKEYNQLISALVYEIAKLKGTLPTWACDDDSSV